MSELLKISTWNINSVRLRIEAVTSWLQRNNVDILLLQEIKCQNEQFPFGELEDLGYNCYVLGQKSYNGVAIISKYKADEVLYSFEDNPLPNESRYIEIMVNLPIGYSRVASIYVPNGAEVDSDKYKNKIQFLEALKKYLGKRDFTDKLIIGGDFNVAPEEIDVYSAAEMNGQTCFTYLERSKIREIKNIGLIDPFEFLGQDNLYNVRESRILLEEQLSSTAAYLSMSEEPRSGSSTTQELDSRRLFTWWDYRAGCFDQNKGLRIDYFLTSSNCASKMSKLDVDKKARSAEKPSDHAPVILTFNKG